MTTPASHPLVELFMSRSLYHGLCQQLSATVTSATIAFLFFTLIFFPYMFRKVGCHLRGEVFSAAGTITYLDVLKKIGIL